MDNPAAVTDVQSRFPRALTTDEQTMATTLLGDAWIDLQAKVTDLVTRLEATPADAALLAQTIRVLAQSVKRVLLNPFGRKQESRGIDDAQRSWTLDPALASGELFFTDEELNSLQAADSTDTRGKAFSVQPWFDTTA